MWALKAAARAFLLMLVGALSGAVLFSIAAPLVLYGYGLGVVPGHPSPSAPPATESWALEVWRDIDRTDRIEVRPMTPWTPISRLVAGSPLENRWPGELAAARIATQYVYDSAAPLPNWKWHIATYAEMVWITRHWNAAEVASEVAEMEQKRRALLAGQAVQQD